MLYRKQFLTAFIDVRRKMFSDCKRELDSAEILPTGRYHEEGAVIIRELLKRESISERTFYDLVSRDIGDKLLGKKVFTLHFVSREVTFKSTLMKRFCEENSALWGGNE
jgi:hypothetical protein